MGEGEVNITYETLFDFLRREKNNEEISKLPDEFYADVMDYLGEKFKILEESKQSTDSFSNLDKEKTSEDLLSIRKVLKELYNRREKKIVKAALDTAMINAPIANTEHMLDYELELYNKAVKLFKQFRTKVLMRLLEAKEPEHLNNFYPKPSEAELPKEIAPIEEADGLMTVVFLEDVEMFVGRELEEYGPFKKEDEAELPEDMAQILIEKGSAKEKVSL